MSSPNDNSDGYPRTRSNILDLLNVSTPSEAHRQGKDAADNRQRPMFNNGVRRRMRKTLVCKACKKAKVKCSRERPKCARCIKLGITCDYNIVRTPPLESRRQSIKIERLAGELNYWKAKVAKLTEEMATNQPVNGDTFDRGAEGQLNDSDIKVNLYKLYPTMVFSRLIRYDAKPLSENFLMARDKFLSTFMASLFLNSSRSSVIPALTADMGFLRAQPEIRKNILNIRDFFLKNCKDPVQRAQINEFIDRLLKNRDPEGNVKVSIVLSILYHSAGHGCLEDRCRSPEEYSPVLKGLLTELEAILPPLDIIIRYKNHFYTYIYQTLPFLDLETFDNCISEIIVENPTDPSKVSINLGVSKIHQKIENLSILLVILKITYNSLSSVESDDIVGSMDDISIFLSDSIIKSFPINDNFILLSQRFLAHENWFAYANENVITYLLYIWSFLVLTPEEGDFFLHHPTDVLSSLILTLANSIGLHREPSDFPQFKLGLLEDKRLINQRRLLWLSTVSVCSMESTLKGRHPILLLDKDLLSSIEEDVEFAQQHMRRVREDLIASESTSKKVEEKFHFYEHGLKRVQVILQLANLDRVTLSCSETFFLDYAEYLMELIEVNLRDNFQLVDLKEAKVHSSDPDQQSTDSSRSTNFNNSQAIQEEQYQVIGISRDNSATIGLTILQKLMFLRANYAMFLHFNSETAVNKSKFLPYYKRYLIKACVDALNLARYINQIFKGRCYNYVLPALLFEIKKIVQLAIPASMFCLLGIILRVTLAYNTTVNKSKEIPRESELSEDMLLTLDEFYKKSVFLHKIIKILGFELETLHKQASEKLRFRFFSVFKLFTVFDAIIQKLREGTIWSEITTIGDTSVHNPGIEETLKAFMGISTEQRDEWISELNEKNYIEEFTSEDLGNIYRRLCQLDGRDLDSLFENVDGDPGSQSVKEDVLETESKGLASSLCSFESNVQDQELSKWRDAENASLIFPPSSASPTPNRNGSTELAGTPSLFSPSSVASRSDNQSKTSLLTILNDDPLALKGIDNRFIALQNAGDRDAKREAAAEKENNVQIPSALISQFLSSSSRNQGILDQDTVQSWNLFDNPGFFGLDFFFDESLL